MLKWIWVIPKIGVPQNGWFIRENPIKMGWFGGTIIFGNTHIFFSGTIVLGSSGVFCWLSFGFEICGLRWMPRTIGWLNQAEVTILIQGDVYKLNTVVETLLRLFQTSYLRSFGPRSFFGVLWISGRDWGKEAGNHFGPEALLQYIYYHSWYVGNHAELTLKSKSWTLKVFQLIAAGFLSRFFKSSSYWASSERPGHLLPREQLRWLVSRQGSCCDWPQDLALWKSPGGWWLG